MIKDIGQHVWKKDFLDSHERKGEILQEKENLKNHFQKIRAWLDSY